MMIRKLIVVNAPYFTGGEAPALGPAFLCAALRASGGSVIPMDLEWLDCNQVPAHIQRLRNMTGLNWDPSGIPFVSHLPLLLYLFGYLKEPTWQVMGVHPIDAPPATDHPENAVITSSSFGVSLNTEARELTILALGLEARAECHADLVRVQAKQDSARTVAISCTISSLIPSLLLASKLTGCSTHDSASGAQADSMSSGAFGAGSGTLKVILGGSGLWRPEVRALAGFLVPGAVILPSGSGGLRHLAEQAGARPHQFLSLLQGPFPWKGCADPFMGFPMPGSGLRNYPGTPAATIHSINTGASAAGASAAGASATGASNTGTFATNPAGFMASASPYMPAALPMICPVQCAFCAEPAVVMACRGSFSPPGPSEMVWAIIEASQIFNGKSNCGPFPVMACSSYVNHSSRWITGLEREMRSALAQAGGTQTSDPGVVPETPNWWGYLRPSENILKAGNAESLKAAGLRWATLGMESGSAAILEKLGKKTDPKLFTEITEKLLSQHIQVLATFLTGHPGESEIDFNNTLRAVSQLKGIQQNSKLLFLQISSLMRLEPGSPIFENPEKWGIEIFSRKIPSEIKNRELKQILSLMWLSWRDKVSWKVKMERRRSLAEQLR